MNARRSFLPTFPRVSVCPGISRRPVFARHPFVTRFALISFSFYPVISAISGSQLKGNGEISFRLGFKDIWMQQTRSRAIGSWTNMIYDWSLFNSLLTSATVNLVAWSSLHVLLLQSILYHSTPFHALTHALFSLPRVFFSSSITSRRPWSDKQTLSQSSAPLRRS